MRICRNLFKRRVSPLSLAPARTRGQFYWAGLGFQPLRRPCLRHICLSCVWQVYRSLQILLPFPLFSTSFITSYSLCQQDFMFIYISSLCQPKEWLSCRSFGLFQPFFPPTFLSFLKFVLQSKNLARLISHRLPRLPAVIRPFRDSWWVKAFGSRLRV